MIGIQIINSTSPYTFGERLEEFLNEHPEANVLAIKLKGIEGGKGILGVVSYDKKEKVLKNEAVEAKLQKEKELKEKKAAEIKELKAKLKEKELEATAG